MTNLFCAPRRVLSASAVLLSAALLTQAAPTSKADGCGDNSTPSSNCADPTPPQQAPAWLGVLAKRDPQFAASYLSTRGRILEDGAIPAKYKLLMGMVTDAIAAHPGGVRTLADNARAAGASEAEITEAVEVGYLYGGTAALVMGVNAFPER